MLLNKQSLLGYLKKRKHCNEAELYFHVPRSWFISFAVVSAVQLFFVFFQPLVLVLFFTAFLEIRESACHSVQQHGEHYRMQLFEGADFAGQCVELCEDVPFLQGQGLSKNCINSIKVYGDGAYVSS